MSYHGLGLDLSPQGMGQQVATYLDPMLRTVLAQEGPKLIAQVGPMVAAQIPSFVAQVTPVITKELPGIATKVVPPLLNAVRPAVQAEIVKLRPILEQELADVVNAPVVKEIERKAVMALALHAVCIIAGVAVVVKMMKD